MHRRGCAVVGLDDNGEAVGERELRGLRFGGGRLRKRGCAQARSQQGSRGAVKAEQTEGKGYWMRQKGLPGVFHRIAVWRRALLCNSPLGLQSIPNVQFFQE